MTDDTTWLKRLLAGEVKGYRLEALLRKEEPDTPWSEIVARAATLRRRALAEETGVELDALGVGLASLPVLKGERELLRIENGIGTVQIPVGIAGPVRLAGDEANGSYRVPLATNEAALVAGLNRGIRLACARGPVKTKILRDGMTRAPLVRFKDEAERGTVFEWARSEEARDRFERATEATTRFGRFLDVLPIPDPSEARYGYLRFRFFTGDAMGMNMVTVATEACCRVLEDRFDGFEVLALSGNLCSDKKQTGINIREGRGLSLKAEATVGAEVLKKRDATPAAIELVNRHKNLRGGEIAETIGGFNAHAANPIAALFAATGQDLAQVVESASCTTTAEVTEEGDLSMAVSLPCLEVGTVGGGTGTPSAKACLEILGIAGGGDPPGTHRRILGEITAAVVLAGELNLLTALARGELAESHDRLRR